MDCAVDVIAAKVSKLSIQTMAVFLFALQFMPITLQFSFFHSVFMQFFFVFVEP